MTQVQDRAVIVTGSNGGIGSGLVDFLLSNGFTKIVCNYHNSSDTILAVLEKHGLDPDLYLVQADLTDEAAIQKMHVTVAERFGRIWGLVNLAGMTTNAVSWKMTLKDFRSVIDANLTSTFLTCREFIPDMRAAGGGRIINTSSVVAHIGAFGAAHYAAAKSGNEGYTKTLAVELAPKGITANSLSLGYFAYGIINAVPDAMLHEIKKRIPFNRLGNINEVAAVVAFLLGDDSSYVTGQSLHINGGQYF